MLEVKVQMYYDEYERESGDGFYPLLSLVVETMKPVCIVFNYDEEAGVWVQTTEEMIKGLDGSCGKELLHLLNEKGGVNGVGVYSYCPLGNFGILLGEKDWSISPFYKRPMISGASSSGFSTISPLKK